MSARRKDWVLCDGNGDALSLPQTDLWCWRTIAAATDDDKTWQEVKEDLETAAAAGAKAQFLSGGLYVTYELIHKDWIEEVTL